jgi:nitrogen fixation NifU-like protein
VTVRLKVEDGRIQDAAFQGMGCAISRASASLMTAAVKGQTPQQATELFQQFHRLVTGHPEAADPETLGKLAVFSGVSAYPIRVKCASLPWHTMKAALDQTREAD